MLRRGYPPCTGDDIPATGDERDARDNVEGGQERDDNATMSSQRGTGEDVRLRRYCSYTRGGICHLHGPGARRMWRPARRGARGRHGEDYTRVYSYVCDLGPRGRGLRQATLSFGRTTLPGVTRRQEERQRDTKQGELGDDTPTGGN